jgi:putative ABC transport system substrate-binding protein
MRRRDFITLLGSAGVAWPFGVRAQQPAMPVIGLINSGSPGTYTLPLAALRQGLKETGFVAGQNVLIEYRWANGQYDRLPALAAELVHRPVAVIVAATPIAALTAKQATASVPIVFALGSDPVKDGLVPNLNRPGGNITGATFFSNLLDKKRLDLVHQLVPNAKVVAMLLNPKNPEAELQAGNAQEAARALGLGLAIVQASTEREIDELDASLVQQRAAALLIAGDAFLADQADHIVKLANRNVLPTCFYRREQVVAGSLMSYGASLNDTYRQAGNYAGRILKGEKPGDLPVHQPTKFELFINMKTAKTLALTVPPTLLALADDVIE